MAGLYYGAGASEAPMCTGKKIFIVGGGNSAGQAAMNFARTAESVTLIVRGESLAATLSHYLLDRIAHTSNVRVVFESSVSAIYGDTQLEALQITSKAGRTQVVSADRLFVCIGGAPNTKWAKDTTIVRDRNGYQQSPSILCAPDKPSRKRRFHRSPKNTCQGSQRANRHLLGLPASAVVEPPAGRSLV